MSRRPVTSSDFATSCSAESPRSLGSLPPVRRLSTLLPLLLVLLVVGSPALAQSVSEVSEELELRRYYIGSGADVTIDEMEQLVDRFSGFGFVALDGTPQGGADLLADELLNAAPSIETVIVLTADEAGAASALYDDASLDRAFDTAFSTTGDTYVRDFEQVASTLSQTARPPEDQTTDESGGGLSFVWIVALAVIGYFVFRLWANSRQDDRATGRRLTEARAELETQVAVVANQILELSDHPQLSSHSEATAHFRTASEIFRSAETRLATAASTTAYADLSDDLDDARWELAAAEALLEGRPVPERPEEEHPEPCFFDPTHGAGVEAATLRTPAGERTVKVCRADAERLRNGEHPEPRSVTVDGKAVPAPKAPRSHGGQGMDALDIFSIILGGMGDGASYRWGRGRRSPNVFGGVGGGFGGAAGRSRGSASAARSSVGRAIGRSIGRARRGR